MYNCTGGWGSLHQPMPTYIHTYIRAYKPTFIDIIEPENRQKKGPIPMIAHRPLYEETARIIYGILCIS